MADRNNTHDCTSCTNLSHQHFLRFCSIHPLQHLVYTGTPSYVLLGGLGVVKEDRACIIWFEYCNAPGGIWGVFYIKYGIRKVLQNGICRS